MDLVRTPPDQQLKYNGITVLLSHAGRFDKNDLGPGRLANGPAHRLLEDALSTTKLGRYAMDFRTISCREPLLPETKVVICSGEAAALVAGVPRDRFHAMRGTPIERNGVIYLPTFHLQDACDIQPYEKRLNPLFNTGADSTSESDSYDSESEEGDDISSPKEYGKTSRKNYYTWTKFDIRKAVRLRTTGLRRINITNALLLRPELGAVKLDAYADGFELYFDLETDPLTGRIICVGFSDGLDTTYSVSMQPNMYGQMQNLPGLAMFYKSLIRAFRRCSKIIIHNAQFDLWILAHIYKIPPPTQEKIYDTMVAHHRLFVGLEKSLGHCISLYTDEPYHKDEAIFTPNNTAQLQQLLGYNAKDVSTMVAIKSEQTRIAQSIPGATESIAQGNREILPLLLKSLRGMLLDTGRLCKTIDEHRKRADIIQNRVLPVLGGVSRFNVNSPVQVGKLLYDTLGLPRPAGGVSLTGKETLYGLAVKYPLPILKAIVMTRAISHEASQLSFQLWRGDRVTSHLEATTDSFRLRSRKLFGKWGTNVQNWPKKLRSVVKARPGWKLIQVDQKNAEALIVAYLVRATSRYRQLLLSGIKLHTYVALHLFKPIWDQLMEEDVDRFLRCPIHELRKQPRIDELDKIIRASDANEPSTRWYYMAKQTGLSANYDVGPYEFSKNTLKKSDGQVFIPIRDAERFLDTYRVELFPEIKTEFQDYIKQCSVEGVLRNFFGHPRVLQEHPQARSDKYYLKKQYAWIPQSTVGSLTNIADCELQLKLDRGELEGFEVWTNTHDSLLVHAPEDRAIEVARIVQVHMNRTLTNPWGESFQMQSDASIGDNWYEVKETKTGI